MSCDILYLLFVHIYQTSDIYVLFPISVENFTQKYKCTAERLLNTLASAILLI